VRSEGRGRGTYGGQVHFLDSKVSMFNESREWHRHLSSAIPTGVCSPITVEAGKVRTPHTRHRHT